MPNLVNPAVQDPTTGEVTFGPIHKIVKKLAEIEAKQAEPQAAKIDETLAQKPVPGAPQPDPEAGQTSPGVDLQGTPQSLYEANGAAEPPAVASGPNQFEAAAPVQTPKIQNPSFEALTKDQYGNVVTPPSGSVTKLGRLMTLLQGGVQGALDAVAGGALDAVPHRSSIGAGAEAASVLPLLRAQRAQAIQQGEAQTQIARGQAQFFPFLQRLSLLKGQADLAHVGAQTTQAQAEAAKAGAETSAIPTKQLLEQTQAEAANYKEDPNLGLIDIRTKQPVGGSAGLAPLTPEEAVILGKQPGERVPLKLKNTANEIVNRGVHMTQAGGRSLMVDSKGNTIKDLGAATPVVVNNLNNGPYNNPGNPTPGVTGDAALAGVNPKLAPIVKKVGDYGMHLNEALSRVPPAGKAGFMAALQAYNPTYDEKNYDAISAMQKDFANPGAKGGGSILAFNTALSHLGLLKQAADALQNGKYPLANEIGNKLSLQLGEDKVASFTRIKSYLGSELAKAFGGGVSTDSSRKEAEDILGSYQSPDQLHGMLTDVARLLQGKMGAMESFYRQQKGSEPPNGGFVSPESHKVLQQLGVEAPPSNASFDWNSHPKVQP